MADSHQQPRSVIRVECYSGYKADERPTAIWVDGEKKVVDRIIDQWAGEDHRYFKLRGDDNGTYILRHDVSSGNWELTMFESAPGTCDRRRLL